MANRIPRAYLSPRDQGAFVKALFPSFTCSCGIKLVCRGTISPSPLSNIYRVRIEYDGVYAPKAWLEDPQLRPREPGGRIPHTYNNERPCFFTPGVDWHRDLKIALTVIPWLSLWLLYYEAWHATGVWQGGGTHPTEFDSEEKRDVQGS